MVESVKQIHKTDYSRVECIESCGNVVAFSKGPYLFLYNVSEDKIYSDPSWNHNNVVTGK